MQKFENVDILKSLKAIMQTHTEHFQSDFDIDVKILKQAAKSQNPEDKKYLWICRPAGMILSILVDTFISKISLPMQPVPEIGSISVA